MMIGFMVATLTRQTARADDADPWFGRDKALHFSASAVIASGGYGLSRLVFDDRRPCLLIGGGLAAAAGIGKELYDLSGHGDASFRDLTWDAIGTATGLLVAWLVDRSLQSLTTPSSMMTTPSSMMTTSGHPASP
jgi:putative lipoprotein